MARFYGLQSVDVQSGQCTYRNCSTKELQIFNTTPAIAQKLDNWLNNVGPQRIQNAVPELSASQRELMLSGLGDDQWDKITKPVDEDEEEKADPNEPAF